MQLDRSKSGLIFIMRTRRLLLVLILCLCIGIATGIFWFFRATLLPSSKNLLQDFSFEMTSDTFPSPWFFQVQSTAVGEITQDKSSKTHGVYSAKVTILSEGEKSYDVQLQQRNIPLQANQNYQISFEAKADSKRRIAVASQHGVAPYTGYANRSFAITKTWHTYTFLFTPPVTDTNSLINFNLAETTGIVWLDNIRIVPVRTPTKRAAPEIIPGNMIHNNSFDDTQNEFPYPWIFQNQNNAMASVFLDDAEKKDGAFSARITIEIPGQHEYDMQLIQKKIALIRGKQYQVKFWAKATSSRFFSVVLQKPIAPYTIYSSRIFVVHADWHMYRYFFTAPLTDASTQIALNVGRTKGSVWFDGITLAPGTPPPSPKYTEKKPQAIYTGVAVDSTPGNMTLLSQFEKTASKAASIYGFYQPWGASPTLRTFQPKWMNTIRNHGSIPLITWEPWNPEEGTIQPTYRLQQIISGKFDPYIIQFAQAARTWGHPFFLRFAHEMNTDTYPWSELVNGNEPGQYVLAWKHVYNIFAEQGVTNVTWVWSPYTKTDGTIPLEEVYPGDDYVHWVGMDGYNWGDDGKHSWTDFSSLFKQTYHDILFLTKKPMMIAEIASSDDTKGAKADWVSDAYSKQIQHNFPAVKAVIWFNYDKEHDWRISSSPEVQSAFVKAIASPYYLENTFSEFNSTPIPDPSKVNLRSIINPKSDEK